MSELSTELVKYDAMCHAIDAAYEIDEVKDIRDRVAALEHYSRQAHNVEAERRCCEIRLRAERKAGALLQQMEKAPGGNPSFTPRGSEKTLGELGITYDQSSQWQKLASVPLEEFEAALARPHKPTTAGIITAASSPKPMPDIDPEIKTDIEQLAAAQKHVVSLFHAAVNEQIENQIKFVRMWDEITRPPTGWLTPAELEERTGCPRWRVKRWRERLQNVEAYRALLTFYVLEEAM